MVSLCRSFCSQHALGLNSLHPFYYFYNLVRVARSPKHEAGSSGLLIRSVAICAGSGSSILLPCEADLYLTGEMSHHEMLASTAKGTSCILTEHSNSERGYLQQRLKPYLESEINKSLSISDPPIDVVTSNVDRDPVSIE